MGKYVAIVSGGLDSTTLTYDIKQQGHEVHCVSFDYGQRHKKELDFAIATSMRLGFQHTLINLSQTSLMDILATSGSSLVDSTTPVPDGHYAEDAMKKTVVPNRNMMMLSIGGSIAVAVGAQRVATGVHAGDHFIYPDCRPDFIRAAHEALVYGNEGFGDLGGIYAPFLNKTKADIAYDAIELKVPLNETWSCYKGGDIHCGTCGTCVERLEAIDEAVKRYDPESYHLYGTAEYDKTQYTDNEFWKTAEVRG